MKFSYTLVALVAGLVQAQPVEEAVVGGQAPSIEARSDAVLAKRVTASFTAYSDTGKTDFLLRTSSHSP